MQKTIFITGSSSGLGKAAAKLFQSKGWKVIATMRNPEKETELSYLENVTVLPLDITNLSQITETVKKVLESGDVDVVLNNAAYGIIGPLEGVSDEQLVKLIDTDLLGAIRVTQSFIPYFRNRQSGTFVNVTSMAGLVTYPLSCLYQTVKFGLQAFSEGVSYELGRFGIMVKTVAPGFIRTPFVNNGIFSSAEPYNDLMNKFMGVAAGMINPETSGSTPEQIAEVLYEAATDGKDQLLYLAGDDARRIYERRLEIGTEASRKETGTMFLG